MSDYKDKILFGDALQVLQDIPDETAQMCVTSPPYWGLRDYGVEGQLGLEETPEDYVERLVDIFSEVKRVLKDDGTLWLNLGDTYSATRWSNTSSTTGISGRHSDVVTERKTAVPDKNLVGIPWRVAFALQKDGWYLRSDIIWHKPNPMPESVKDRPTNSHEHIFLLSKSKSYYYDHEAIAEETESPIQERERENGVSVEEQGRRVGNGNITANCGVREKRNKRDVWQINTRPFPEAHFAVYPPELITPCIKAGSKENDIVLDPFIGSGTTAQVAKRLNRHYLGIDLNKDYEEIQFKRLQQQTLNI